MRKGARQAPWCAHNLSSERSHPPHELGHYLGLHHSDGAWTDHRAGASASDLMASKPGVGLPGDVTFTAAQLAVIRAYPHVVFDRSLP